MYMCVQRFFLNSTCPWNTKLPIESIKAHGHKIYPTRKQTRSFFRYRGPLASLPHTAPEPSGRPLVKSTKVTSIDVHLPLNLLPFTGRVFSIPCDLLLCILTVVMLFGCPPPHLQVRLLSFPTFWHPLPPFQGPGDKR